MSPLMKIAKNRNVYNDHYLTILPDFNKQDCLIKKHPPIFVSFDLLIPQSTFPALTFNKYLSEYSLSTTPLILIEPKRKQICADSYYIINIKQQGTRKGHYSSITLRSMWEQTFFQKVK